jgi:hypothetical protein
MAELPRPPAQSSLFRTGRRQTAYLVRWDPDQAQTRPKGPGPPWQTKGSELLLNARTPRAARGEALPRPPGDRRAKTPGSRAPVWEKHQDPLRAPSPRVAALLSRSVRWPSAGSGLPVRSPWSSPSDGNPGSATQSVAHPAAAPRQCSSRWPPAIHQLRRPEREPLRRGQSPRDTDRIRVVGQRWSEARPRWDNPAMPDQPRTSDRQAALAAALRARTRPEAIPTPPSRTTCICRRNDALSRTSPEQVRTEIETGILTGSEVRMAES